MKLRATIDDKGKFQFTGSKEWVKMKIQSLGPGDWDVVFRRHVKERTPKQMRYYFGVIVPMVYQGLRDAGFDEIMDHEDVHELLKGMFFTKTIFSQEHGEISVVASTKKFSTFEFGERWEQIWAWAKTFLNIDIPPPNTQMAIDYADQQ